MADLFGRTEQVLAGGLSSDRLFMSFSNLPNFGLGLLIQNVGTSYQQPLRRIYELGPGVVVSGGGLVACAVPTGCADSIQTTYYAVGRATGNFQFSRVAGAEAIAAQFYQTYGSPCTSNVLSYGGRISCSNGILGPLSRWTMTGLVINQYQNSAAPEQAFIQEGAAGEFTNLYIQVIP